MPAPTPTKPVGVARPDANVDPVPVTLAGLCPDQVTEASAALADAESARAVARDAAAAARQAAEDAAAADREAAQEAAAAGRKLPGASVHKATSRAEEAGRVVEAQRALVAEAKRALLDAVNAHREQIAERVEAELDELAVEAGERLATLEGLIARRRELRTFERALDPSTLTGREAGFNPATPTRPDRDPLAGKARTLLNDLRGTVAPRRLKDPSEWTAEEQAAAEEARSRGQRQPEFERPEFVAWEAGA
jgi:general stress protein YciG